MLLDAYGIEYDERYVFFRLNVALFQSAFFRGNRCALGVRAKRCTPG